MPQGVHTTSWSFLSSSFSAVSPGLSASLGFPFWCSSQKTGALFTRIRGAVPGTAHFWSKAAEEQRVEKAVGFTLPSQKHSYSEFQGPWAPTVPAALPPRDCLGLGSREQGWVYRGLPHSLWALGPPPLPWEQALCPRLCPLYSSCCIESGLEKMVNWAPVWWYCEFQASSPVRLL